jgi:membrane protein DedA with SNARE-associated domain
VELLNRLLAVAHGHGFLYCFVVSLFEGEFSLILAGVLVKEGTFRFLPSFLGAFFGAAFIYNFWYWLGRLVGEGLLERFPKFKEKEKTVEAKLNRWGALLAFLVPFIYGLRTASAFFLGLFKFPFRVYAAAVTFSCAVWAFTLLSVGYFFGKEAEKLWKSHSLLPLTAVVGIIVLLVLLKALGYFVGEDTGSS